MDTYETLILTRSLERIVAAILGGGAIYLAYAVFTKLPDISHLQDNFKFRQYLRFHFIKIIAGVCFLIFGGYIVLATVMKTVRLEIKEDNTQIYSGITNGSEKNVRKSRDLINMAALSDYFRMLDQVPTYLSDSTDGSTRFAVQLAVTRTRLQLMLALWDDERWGDRIAFREWVIDGSPSVISPSIKSEAIDFYFGK